jgi:non-heme chloroperoxidase
MHLVSHSTDGDARVRRHDLGEGSDNRRNEPMPTVCTRDGTQIYYKDWGIGQPVIFSHGWPLNADAWDDQLFFMASNGFRSIAHDRRGHGRSSQPWEGNDMDHYADDLAELIEALDVHDVILVGHSTGGGELVRYISRHGTSRISGVVLVGAVPLLSLRTRNNPVGLPSETFDRIRQGVLQDRAQFYKDLSESFYGTYCPSSPVSQGVRDAFWFMSMQVGVKAAHDSIKQFSDTDFNDDLKKVDVPILVIHGDNDQIVPLVEDSGWPTASLVPRAELKVYAGAPHGLPQTHKRQLNEDILEFARRSLHQTKIPI